ncbi:MAG: hypothetical protein ACRCUJ_06620 [Phocaeicola sp.]
MGREKGTRKTGGRKVGTPNRTTSTLKEWVASLLDNNREQIESDLASLEPKERLTMLFKLMDYTLPKASQAIEEPHSTTVDFIQASIHKCNEIENENRKQEAS